MERLHVRGLGMAAGRECFFSCRFELEFQSDTYDKDQIERDNINAQGSMLVPIIAGSDKTTVSVATGQNDYYPLYMSIGNIHNETRQAHGSGLVLIGFLAISKSKYVSLPARAVDLSPALELEAEKKYDASDEYRLFKRQLFHDSLAKIFKTLKPGMTLPEVMQCPDGHLRRIIFRFGPYIADYPEQVLLACVSTGWCPR